MREEISKDNQSEKGELKMQLYLLYSYNKGITSIEGCYSDLEKLEKDTIKLINVFRGTLNTSKTIEEQVRERIEYLENLKKEDPEDEYFNKTTINCWADPYQKEIVEITIELFMENEYKGDYYD